MQKMQKMSNEQHICNCIYIPSTFDINTIRHFGNDVDDIIVKFKYNDWIIKYFKSFLDQIKKNHDLYTSMLFTNRSGIIIVNSYTINNSFLMYKHNQLVKSPDMPKIKYLVDLNTYVCSCPSFQYNNYHIKGSCKHLERCRKINDVILSLESLKRTYFYGVSIPMDKMILSAI